MADQKGLGSKFLGLFVEREGKGAPDDEAPAPEGEKSAADLVAELAGQGPQKAAPHPGHPAPAGDPGPAMPPLPPRAPPGPNAAPLAPGHFDQVLKDAGLGADDLDRVKKAEELLKGLPADAPVAMKRQIVEMTLRTMGIEVVKIVQAAQKQLGQLDKHVKANEDATQAATQAAQAQIKQLDERIIELKVAIEKRVDALQQVRAAADQRKNEVQKVVDFFAQPAEAPKS